MENQPTIITPQPTEEATEVGEEAGARAPQKFAVPLVELPARFSMLAYLTDGESIAFRVQIDLSSGIFPRRKEIKDALAHVCKVAQDNYFKEHKLIKKFRVMNKREFFNRIVFEERGIAGDFAPADIGEFNRDDVGEALGGKTIIAAAIFALCLLFSAPAAASVEFGRGSDDPVILSCGKASEPETVAQACAASEKCCVFLDVLEAAAGVVEQEPDGFETLFEIDEGGIPTIVIEKVQ